MDGAPLAWFCPPKRAILETDHLHLSRSLRRLQNKNEIRFSIDQAFSTVISHCAEVPRPGQTGTWITDDIQQAYGELHRLGYAHSIEAWRDQTLVGGLYGVEVEGVFSGESMFHLESNVSKLVILFLMDYLANQKAPWMDIQVMTPHMKALGAREISRTLFLKKLADAQKQTLKLFPSRSKRE
jgi:leucyl/phenylalanyl-tRNA--protein transferase